MSTIALHVGSGTYNLCSDKRRGKQFTTAPAKRGQQNKQLTKFQSVDINVPYIDNWKRTNRHYARPADGKGRRGKPFKDTDLMKVSVPKAIRQRGVLSAGGFEGAFDTPANHPHVPDFGAHVAIPTRKPDMAQSYLKAGTERKKTQFDKRQVQTNPAKKGGTCAKGTLRTTFPKGQVNGYVDDYTAQERIRNQMVMGMGQGCRGISPRKLPGAAGRRKREVRPSFRGSSKHGGLFDTNNVYSEEHLPPQSSGSRSSREEPMRHPVPFRTTTAQNNPQKHVAAFGRNPEYMADPGHFNAGRHVPPRCYGAEGGTQQRSQHAGVFSPIHTTGTRGSFGDQMAHLSGRGDQMSQLSSSRSPRDWRNRS